FNRRHGTRLSSPTYNEATSPPPLHRRSPPPPSFHNAYSKASKIPISKSAKEKRHTIYPDMLSAEGKAKNHTRVIIDSKPPLPPTSAILHSRPPTRLSSKNSWATSTDRNNNYTETRPISPITRGKNSSSSFQYTGPHQVYSGPIEKVSKSDLHVQTCKPATLADGPESLHYSPSAIQSGASSTSQEYHRNLCEKISGFPLPPRRKSRQRAKSRRSLCEKCRRESVSLEDVRPSTQTNSPGPPVPCLNNHNPCVSCAFKSFIEKSKTQLAKGDSKSQAQTQTQTNQTQTSSASAPTISQQQQSSPFPTNSHLPNSCPSLPPRGPFPTGVPSEIHDDLIRMEMLMELRKFNQAKERMLHLVNGCGAASLPHISQNFTGGQAVDPLCQQHLYPFAGLQNRSMEQQDPFQIFSLNTVNVEGPSNVGVSGGGGNPSRENQVVSERPLTVWEHDLAKHLDSSNFYTPILEPHSQPLINKNSKENGEAEDKAASQQVTLSENAYLINQAILNMQKTQNQRVNLVKEPNSPDGFRGSPSVFPSELMSGLQQRSQSLQNPLIAGAGLNMSVPNYEHTDRSVPAGNYSRKTFVPLDPVSLPTGFSQQSPPQQRSSPLGSPFQQFILENNTFYDRHHNIPSGFPQQEFQQPSDQMHFWDGGQMIMLRKPVAISKNRSPINYFTASPGTPQSASTTFGSSNEDRPSPFFPGLSGSRIDIKIRSPEDRLSMRMMEEVNPTDVEKLGNLLSQLPVMSQQQKVEEFTFNTLKPPSPVTEAESTTSMIPMVSSNGTLTSRVASSGDDRPRTGASAIVEIPPTTAKSGTRDISTVDTDKMSIHELVTLGRKIYRILSQLSTHSPSKSVPPTPSFTINPYPTNPPRSFTLNQTSSGMRGQTKSTTSAIVDFSIIPNPTFITGPGANGNTAQSKSTSRVVPDTASKPPNLFRKLHQPPPTRWEKRSNSAHPADFRNPSQVTVPRELSRRSVSTAASKAPVRTPTRTILKWEVATAAVTSDGNNRRSPRSSGSYTIKSYTDANTNNGNYNQNQPSQKPSRFAKGEENSPYTFPTASFLDQSSTKGRASSIGKRNFIQENISKLRKIKPISKTRAPPLPPVTRKYDNVPSVVASNSRARTDRSSSLPREESGRIQRDRSTSLQPQPIQQQQKREYKETNNTFRNNQPSRRPSVPSNSSRSQTPIVAKSRDSVKPKRQARSRNTLPKANNNMMMEESKTGLMGKVKLEGNERSRSALFTSKTAAAAMGILSMSKASVIRKSRSKTRRASAAYKQQMEATRHSSISSAERSQTNKFKGKTSRSVGKKKKGARSASSHWATQRVAPLPQIQLKSNDEDDEPEVDGEKGEFVTNSVSEQVVIREMVKAEMDMMVERHVKDVLLRTKEEKNKDYRSDRYKDMLDSEPEDSILDSENLEPVYTPPRFQDTSLFSLEQWINPEGNQPETAYTSAKDTPATTAEDGRSGNKRTATKPQTVRFSLPQHN
ncbi:hypothetical protein Ocin01_13983, partial [Orchesella cincta]